MRELTPLMWSQLWQATAAIVAVALLTRLFCRRKPYLAYLLWMVVLIKCLTPPVLSSSFGAFGWTQTRSSAPTESRSGPRADADAIDSAPLADARAPAPAEVAPAEVAPAEVVRADASMAEQRGDSSVRSTERFPRIPLLLAVWGVGALGLGGVIVRKWLLLRRVVKRSRAPIDPDLASLAKEVADQLGLRSKIRLVITDEPIGPAVFGVLRPTVLLPEALIRSLSPAELRALLAHELTHVRRRDGWAAALQVVVQTVWWFHPLVWWANRQACRERERCCDREVVARLRCTPASYANVLLKVLETRRSLLPEFGSLGIRPADVTARRLEDIMKRTSGSRRRTPVWRWAIALLTAALLLPGQRTPSIAASDEADSESAAQVNPPKRKRERAARVIRRKGSEAKKDLRYDGKDFAWWRNELRTELKADLRIEGLKAMAAFGINGHGRDATDAIIDVAGSYHDILSGSSSDDQRIHRAAWTEIKRIGPTAVAPMIAAAKDKNRSKRRFAIVGLGRFDRDERIAKVLILATKDTAPPIRRAAAQALGTQGTRGVAALIDALKDEDPRVRHNAALALGRIGPDAVSATPALAVAVNDPDRSVRERVLNALIAIEPDAKLVVPVFAEALRDENASNRHTAIGSLKRLGPQAKAAVPALIKAFSKEPGDRAFVLGSLAAIQPDPKVVIPFYVDALRGDDSAVRGEVMDALARLGPQAKAAVPALIKVVSDAYGDDRYMAAHTLGAIGPDAKAAIPILQKALQTDDDPMRRVFAKAVESISK